MKKKKGFTLIELLAVIVILAIIALIATPIILNMINDAKKSAAKDSAYGYIEAIEYNNGMADLGINNSYTKIEGIDLNVTTLDVKVKGSKPTSGTITIEKGLVTKAELCINNYNVSYDGQVATVTGSCGGNSEGEKPLTNKVYTLGQLVYFDPVTEEECNETTFTGTNTCYKWRVIETEDSELKKDILIQMDHNLINTCRWAYSYSKVNDGFYYMPLSVLNILNSYTNSWERVNNLNYEYDTTSIAEHPDILKHDYGKLSCIDGACSITPNGITITINGTAKARIITAEEVIKIINTEAPISNWDLTVKGSGHEFYFSNKNEKLGYRNFVDSNTNLSWLIENTDSNIDSDATTNVYGEKNLGYWTLSPSNDDASCTWIVYNLGSFVDVSKDDYTRYGVRPVIIMEKSKLS